VILHGVEFPSTRYQNISQDRLWDAGLPLSLSAAVGIKLLFDTRARVYKLTSASGTESLSPIFDRFPFFE
jgi:hypothetical protein